jgi:transposase
MRQNSTQQVVCAGIDVGKAWLDVAMEAPGQASWRLANTAQGHAELVARLRQAGVSRVGLEASGGYEAAAVAALRAEAFAVVLFQPRQVRAYGVFKLKRAKSDRIDARLIAQCTCAQDELREAPDPRLGPLAEHLTRIEQIEEDLARARIRRERFDQPRLLAQLDGDIARLKALRTDELKRLGQAVRALPELARKLALLLSIPGIGERTALALVLRMPELGRLSRGQAAALVGVAPFVRESGRFKGERRTGGGRARLRTSLFAATQAAARQWNPALIALYDRITAKGKPHALAIVACVRKLVSYANAIVARDAPWTAAR